MNTKQIDYCIELARTLNFSRAAENSFVSQPTLSYQIRLLEEEIGFDIFERSGKGASLTPAGRQFVIFLTGMREDLKRAIEQGQNFSARYSENISISTMVYQALYFLPEAIKEFEKVHPDVLISPVFQYEGGLNSFLRNESDIYFALEEEVKHIPNINIHPLFKSRIYLITELNDPLASKDLIKLEDLYGRTLMIGGGSPPALKNVQQKVIASGKVRYFNSPDHDTTKLNVASGKGICLAPGFLNDHSGLFSWIPYDCSEHFNCAICTHKNDNRESLQDFLRILKRIYSEAVAFPL